MAGFDYNFKYGVKMLVLGRMDKVTNSNRHTIKQTHESLAQNLDYRSTPFFKFLNEYYSSEPNEQEKQKAGAEICNLIS